MKKSLVSALTTALVVGAASTAFAAANPFEDVPADHWAYDAIAQLAADGVIEGYGDGTYRGDQEITRYEMAQMVARAMAKNPTGADKAYVDKLAAEFHDELNSLGVRVANLEKKVDNVKWAGTVRYRYMTETHKRDRGDVETPERINAQYLTLRLEPEMQINKHWTGHARIDYNSDMNTAKNTTAAIGDDVETGGIRVERMWVQGDYDNFQILLGKLPYLTNVDGGMIFDDNVSGGQITVGNKVKVTASGGRWNGSADDNPAAFADDYGYGPTGSYAGVEIYNDREDKYTWGVAFHRFKHEAMGNAYLGGDKDALNIWEVGLGAKLGANFSLNGAYAWETSTDEGFMETKDISGAKHAWSVELDYKGADESDPGSWGAFVAYRKLGASAVLMPTYDAIAGGQKGVELGFDIVPMKNFMATFKYFIGKDMDRNDRGTGSFNENASKFFTELNFFF